MTPETQFAPLPIRQRSTIEIIDTALKLYRRYFGVLMAWSAIVAVSGLLGSFAFASFFVWPLIYGAGACAIAAAVRGQRISFGQVWDFTKPRYGALLLLLLLTGLLLFAGMMVAMLVSGFLMFGAFYLLQVVDVPVVSAILGVVGSLLALVVGSVASVLAYAWLSMVPIIACLEDDKRSPAAMGRAWDLIKGSWLRVIGLSTLLTLAVLAVMGMVIGSLSLFGQGFDAFINSGDESAIMQWAFTMSGIMMLFFLFWNPIQTLVIAVLYLDLRVRKEALDLEWTSYASAPPSPTEASAATALHATAPDATAPALETHNPAALGAEPLSTSVFAGAATPTAPPRPPAPNPVNIVPAPSEAAPPTTVPTFASPASAPQISPAAPAIAPEANAPSPSAPTSDALSTNAPEANAPTDDDQRANGESANGESANGESANGESANGESANGESANGADSKSAVTPAQTSSFGAGNFAPPPFDAGEGEGASDARA